VPAVGQQANEPNNDPATISTIIITAVSHITCQVRSLGQRIADAVAVTVAVGTRSRGCRHVRVRSLRASAR
jgi:hypothetical protein